MPQYALTITEAFFLYLSQCIIRPITAQTKSVRSGVQVALFVAAWYVFAFGGLMSTGLSMPFEPMFVDDDKS